ncbi:MAG TPA: AAA family ATPase [bacterium]|nr:AAA family ATPase [bacterium]
MGRVTDLARERPPIRILERDTFLKDLKAWRREAAAGAGRLAFIGGEAGVGKTVLVRILAQTVEGMARVAVGACDPLSTPRPLGPLLDVAIAVAPETGRLLEADAERGDVFQAFLSELGQTPTLVIFEDAQWADEATLDLLRFLGRRIGQTRTLLVVTYRADEIGRGHPLTTVLGDLATAEAVRRMTLSPLSEAAVRTLAAGSTLDPAALHRQTGGNPFFVTEVLASGTSGIPATVRDAVLARASRLSAKARKVLDAAAVIGFRIEPWLEATVAGGDADALDECISVGMLRVQETTLYFRHELARDAILETIPLQQRLAHHRAVLAALRSSPMTRHDFPRLAHHAEAAGNRDAVLEYAQQAARRAEALGAHREAAAQYARALRFAEDLPLETQADLLEQRAYQCFLTAQSTEAIAAQERALECRRSLGDRRKEGDSLRALSRVLWCLGRIPEADKRAREAVVLLEELPVGRELAMAYSAMSSVCMNAENAEGTVTWGARALELAEQVEDTETLIHTLNNIGTMELLRGTMEGRQKLERSLELAQQAGLEEHVGRAFIHLAWAAARTRRFDLIDRVAAGLEYASERDLYLWRLWLVAHRSRLELDQGRWNEAAASATFVAHYAHGESMSRIPALCALALVHARRGDPDVWPLLDEALALGGPAGQFQHIAPVASARAEAAWLDNNLEAIDAETRSTYDQALEVRDPWTVGELACWRWRARLLHEPPPGAAEPYALQIAGEWQRAAQRWSEIGCPYETALALADSGEEAVLRQALETFEQLGARPMMGVVARRLREMGVRGIPRGPRASTRAHPGGLTSRELEIAALIVQGLSNLEIAKRSYLSVKTVDHHVSSILAKLGVRGRVDIAREAMRLGLVTELATATRTGK